MNSGVFLKPQQSSTINQAQAFLLYDGYGAPVKIFSSIKSHTQLHTNCRYTDEGGTSSLLADPTLRNGAAIVGTAQGLLIQWRHECVCRNPSEQGQLHS